MKNILVIVGLLMSVQVLSFDHDHKMWDEVLKESTKLNASQVLVNYKQIKKKPGKLDRYLKELEKVSEADIKGFSEKQKLAFYINAYNAYTLQLVVVNYPVKSIKDIGTLFMSPWSKSFINLIGKRLSLDDIEHKIIRKDFKEARIHFAVNCASIGCPSLYRSAFTAKKLEEQLDSATKHFLLNKMKNKVDGDYIYLSKIFDWYGKDFVKYHKSVEAFVSKYMSIKKGMKIKYLKYSWKLNEY